MQRVIEVLLNNFSGFLNYLTPVMYCDEGFNIIRKTFGRPHKIYKTGLCFKLPIIQSFDKVNMKHQVHFLNAHSVKSKNDKIIPYNITVDAQVEFRIVDPFVIYHIDIFDSGNREPIRIYVDNEVHLLINSIIQDEDLKAVDIQNKINEALNKRNAHPEDYLQKAIQIERVIISAFDYNLSIRHAQ